MTRLAWFLLLTFIHAGVANAASFDCRKAATVTEKLICANDDLSALDGRMAAAYKGALGRAGNPGALREEQASWLKTRRDRCREIDCAQAAYLSRIDELQNVAPPYQNLPDAIDHTCIALAASVASTASHCRVTESAQFGSIAGQSFHYALYCLDDPPAESGRCEAAGIGLFAVDATTGKVTRFHLRSSDMGNTFVAPSIVRVRQATLLDMPVGVPGTGNQNASELFVRQADHWAPVDSTSWQADLLRRLPQGLGVWKGIWPDWRTMTAETGLYRSRDANCCPTGGSASIRLALDGTRLALVSVRIHP